MNEKCAFLHWNFKESIGIKYKFQPTRTGLIQRKLEMVVDQWICIDVIIIPHWMVISKKNFFEVFISYWSLIWICIRMNTSGLIRSKSPISLLISLINRIKCDWTKLDLSPGSDHRIDGNRLCKNDLNFFYELRSSLIRWDTKNRWPNNHSNSQFTLAVKVFLGEPNLVVRLIISHEQTTNALEISASRDKTHLS